MEIYSATITFHDFFFYVSREIRLGVTTDVINNTALMYAINSLLTKTQRNASGTKPHYVEDYRVFSIYATPAKIVRSKDVALEDCTKKFDHSTTPQKISYNSVDSTLILSMETSVFHQREKKLAFPKLGNYMKYPPLTTFAFFTIGGIGARVVRVGKKLPPAITSYQKLEGLELKKGVFSPDHPVAIQDLPEESKLLDGNIIILPNGLDIYIGSTHFFYSFLVLLRSTL